MPQMFKRGNRWVSLKEVRETTKEVAEEISESSSEVKKICEHCDAKGPIKHKANCPTLIKK